jgi:hypothetical protein
VTADEYVLAVVNRYRVPTGPGSAAYQIGQAALPLLQEWAGRSLLGVSYSGSYAKGTAIRGGTDVDLFISLSPDTPGSLKDIYNSLVRFLLGKSLAPRPQNVSVGLSLRGQQIDLVPARRQSHTTTDHSLYRRKADTWTQTNVDKHVQVVTSSGRASEIIAIKIWRQLHKLDFPSFYLELTVIDALSGRRGGQPAASVIAVLQYLRDGFSGARVLDPANTNNIISEDLTVIDKLKVAAQAKLSLDKPWAQVIW